MTKERKLQSQMKNSKLILFAITIIYTLNPGYLIARDKPNIVLIIIDDLGWKDAGYMGSTYYQTPNIDRLAGQGMIFTNAYANAANCAPTRACLLSGQYTPRHGVFTVARPDRGKSEDRRLIPVVNSRKISSDKITIAEALEPAGYVSAAIGKWHVADPPQQQGFDVGINKFEIANGYEKGHFNKDNEYLTDRLTSEAVEFITENKDKPFFLYLAHYAVHTPIEAKENMAAKYEKKEAEGCHGHSTYAAMIESVDESVRDIYKTLGDLGLSENTILIFFSDNGGHGTYTCQKPLRGGKGMFYEGGIRVPMFVFWPGTVRGGTKCDFPVIGTDFYPTFMELAGVHPPENYPLDGESIVRLLKGRNSIKRDAIFWHFPAYLEAYDGLKDESRDPVFRTRPVSVIRMGDWKLLMFSEEWVLDGGHDKINSNNSVELYNLKKDEGESKNLCNIKNKKRDKLLSDLLEWQDEINAPIPRQANPDYIEN
jgi:arylsulfatase A-like enzyme